MELLMAYISKLFPQFSRLLIAHISSLVFCPQSSIVSSKWYCVLLSLMHVFAHNTQKV